MVKVTQIFPDETIKQEACMWVAKLDGQDLCAKSRAEFREWLARSPKHRSEFQLYAEPWDTFDDLWREEALAGGNENSTLDSVWKKAKVAMSMAAAVAVIAVSSMFFFNPDNLQSHPAFYSAQIGQYKTITLDDGSQVKLNTDSQIEVLFSDTERKIRLVKGEAWFDVAHDKTKPFLVYAGSGLIRAVGTAFAVQLLKDNVEVTVTEGRVELAAYAEAAQTIQIDVASSDNNPILLAQLDAGQRAQFNSTIEMIETIPMATIEKDLSWQSGLIIFDGEPLESVVNDFSRYTNMEIVISSEQIKEMKISGYFSTTNTTAFLNTLNKHFAIKVDKVSADKVYLSIE